MVVRRVITNPQLNETIAALKKTGRKNKAQIWLRVAEFLGKPKRARVAINVSRIARNTKKGEIVAVPGKVLATGSISHAIHIGAFNFSQTARDKIQTAGGSCMSLSKLADDHPKGSKIKILR
jgi:large subunit ribosomal protein L18e